MKQARKYVVGWKVSGWVQGTRRTWQDAQSAILRFDFIPDELIEAYELVPVAAWKCVEAKDGTRRMVRVSKRA